MNLAAKEKSKNSVFINAKSKSNLENSQENLALKKREISSEKNSSEIYKNDENSANLNGENLSFKENAKNLSCENLAFKESCENLAFKNNENSAFKENSINLNSKDLQENSNFVSAKISQNENSAEKLNLLDFTAQDLEKIISPKFRVKQIFEWIYQKYADDFSQMSSLPKNLREEFELKFHFSPLFCVKFEQSIDKSVKYLFRLADGLTIESVLLPMKDEQKSEDGRLTKHARYTICVSSQVGCKSGCAFCLTAKGGFKRNLSTGEIVGQILWIKKQHKIPFAHRVNVVFMGMGEPLDNLAQVAKAVRILSENLGISPRRQTISTSGLARQIKELGRLNLGVLLAISLHAVDDTLRSQLMPINKAYNIAAVLDAVREFPIDQRKRVMFEYLLLGGVNDSQSHAKALVKLLCGIKAKVNLILFNPHEQSEFRRPSLENAVKFQDFLSAKGITCTIRQSKGLDISAACGQLKERTEK